MKNVFSTIAFTFMLAFTGFTVCQAQTGLSLPISAAPGLQTTSLDGHPVDILGTPGWKVVYFFSSTCPCVAACERYSFAPMAKKYGSEVTFYAVDSDSYDLGLPADHFASLVARHHLPYSVILDTHHELAKYLQASVTPQTFVIDPEGNIVFDGMPDDSRRYLVLGKPSGVGVEHTFLSVALSEAIAGKPVTEPDIPLAGCIIAY